MNSEKKGAQSQIFTDDKKLITQDSEIIKIFNKIRKSCKLAQNGKKQITDLSNGYDSLSAIARSISTDHLYKIGPFQIIWDFLLHHRQLSELTQETFQNMKEFNEFIKTTPRCSFSSFLVQGKSQNQEVENLPASQRKNVANQQSLSISNENVFSSTVQTYSNNQIKLYNKSYNSKNSFFESSLNVKQLKPLRKSFSKLKSSNIILKVPGSEWPLQKKLMYAVVIEKLQSILVFSNKFHQMRLQSWMLHHVNGEKEDQISNSKISIEELKVFHEFNIQKYGSISQTVQSIRDSLAIDDFTFEKELKAFESKYREYRSVLQFYSLNVNSQTYAENCLTAKQFLKGFDPVFAQKGSHPVALSISKNNKKFQSWSRHQYLTYAVFLLISKKSPSKIQKERFVHLAEYSFSYNLSMLWNEHRGNISKDRKVIQNVIKQWNFASQEIENEKKKLEIFLLDKKEKQESQKMNRLPKQSAFQRFLEQHQTIKLKSQMRIRNNHLDLVSESFECFIFFKQFTIGKNSSKKQKKSKRLPVYLKARFRINESSKKKLQELRQSLSSLEIIKKQMGIDWEAFFKKQIDDPDQKNHEQKQKNTTEGEVKKKILEQNSICGEEESQNDFLDWGSSSIKESEGNSHQKSQSRFQKNSELESRPQQTCQKHILSNQFFYLNQGNSAENPCDSSHKKHQRGSQEHEADHAKVRDSQAENQFRFFSFENEEEAQRQFPDIDGPRQTQQVYKNQQAGQTQEIQLESCDNNSGSENQSQSSENSERFLKNQQTQNLLAKSLEDFVKCLVSSKELKTFELVFKKKMIEHRLMGYVLRSKQKQKKNNKLDCNYWSLQENLQFVAFLITSKFAFEEKKNHAHYTFQVMSEFIPTKDHIQCQQHWTNHIFEKGDYDLHIVKLIEKFKISKMDLLNEIINQKLYYLQSKGRNVFEDQKKQYIQRRQPHLFKQTKDLIIEIFEASPLTYNIKENYLNAEDDYIEIENYRKNKIEEDFVTQIEKKRYLKCLQKFYEEKSNLSLKKLKKYANEIFSEREPNEQQKVLEKYHRAMVARYQTVKEILKRFRLLKNYRQVDKAYESERRINIKFAQQICQRIVNIRQNDEYLEIQVLKFVCEELILPTSNIKGPLFDLQKVLIDPGRIQEESE